MSQEEDREMMAVTLMGCLCVLMMLPISIILRGFVLAKLWFWFIVPLGVPAIGLAHAYGISILLAMVVNNVGDFNVKKEDKVWTAIFRLLSIGVGVPILMWFFGWICYLFM